MCATGTGQKVWNKTLDPKVGRQALRPSGEGGVSGGGGPGLLEQQQGCQCGWRDAWEDSRGGEIRGWWQPDHRDLEAAAGLLCPFTTSLARDLLWPLKRKRTDMCPSLAEAWRASMCRSNISFSLSQCSRKKSLLNLRSGVKTIWNHISGHLVDTQCEWEVNFQRAVLSSLFLNWAGLTVVFT